jgi:hypothetical protein
MQPQQSMQIEDIINIFLERSVMLTRILQKESEYIQGNQYKQAEKLIPTKFQILDELESLKGKIDKNKQALRNFPSEVKEQIRKINSQMFEAAKKNFLKATAKKEVNRVIVEAVDKAINKQRKEFDSYSNYANETKSATAKEKASAPIAVNECV